LDLSLSFLLVSFSSLYQPPPPDVYPLSLHDALPISGVLDELQRHLDGMNLALLVRAHAVLDAPDALDLSLDIRAVAARLLDDLGDRKSTRLNSSHVKISYAVFCLKKKKIKRRATRPS